MSAPPSPPAAPALWTPPNDFDEYRLIKQIGRGRTGRVYLAQDTLLERAVAVKFIPAISSGALTRFLVEARAAARLQHPNVVTLYRVGQLDNRPYLVSEFIRGESLDKLSRPVPWRRTLDFAMDLARGLGAAHRSGVLHRDVKPGNAVLTEDGTVKLLDFGLAKLLDAPELRADLEEASLTPEAERVDLPSLPPGARVGTPYYMSPEAWAGDELTARSDLFSLGLLLYELCASKGPFRDVPAPHLSEVVRRRDARPLSEVLPGVNLRFAAVVDRCLKRVPSERFASAEALLEALADVAQEQNPGRIPEGNPYRGLQAFEAEHRALFFGRRRELQAVMERLKGSSLLVMAGDSGVGKSSLCLAGVLPSFVDGGLGDGRQWRTARMVPGRRPLRSLAEALAPILSRPEDSVTALAASEPANLVRDLKVRLGPTGGLLLYVDQLEELVTLSERHEAKATGRTLGALCEGVAGLKLLGTARSDFLTRLTTVEGLGAELPRSLYLLRALSPEETREAVVGPARVTGVHFESEELVDALVASTSGSESGLPLLQFALAELWEARSREQKVIGAAALEALGGVEGALARHADTTLAQLLPDTRSAARGVLLRLVTADGTRARKTDRELVGDDPRYRTAIEALVRARLLVAREAEEGTSYEVAHEALITRWKTFAQWLLEAAERREVQGRLEAAAAHWERRKHSRELLWGPRQLADAKVLPVAELPRREQVFLETSRRTVLRSRRLRQLLLLGFLASLLVVYGVLLLRQRADLQRRIEAQLLAAAEEGQAAEEVAKRWAAARTAAFTRYDAGRKTEAEPLWAEALGLADSLRQLHDHRAGKIERALLLAPQDPRVHDALADFLLARSLFAEATGDVGSLPSFLTRLKLYDSSGRRWRQWESPAQLDVQALPPQAQVVLRPWVRSSQGRMSLGEPVSGGPSYRVPPGDYVVQVSAENHASLSLPLRLGRDERESLQLQLPTEQSVPEGFVYIPPGSVRFGSAAEDSVREFFNAAPLHVQTTPGFLISRYETTYLDWIAFLESLPKSARARHSPRVGNYRGLLELSQEGSAWRLRFQPGSVPYSARAGERIQYAHRAHLREQDWLRFPVTGISISDVQAYTQWLARSGRVPGARLCTELEWERAARGADGREFPHGDQLLPEDANFDQTYGKDPRGFGPDEAGAHPLSRSPFGVDDLAGNAWEWTLSSLEAGKFVAKGGSYYFASNSCRAANRELPEPELRDLTVGLRVCADLQASVRTEAQ